MTQFVPRVLAAAPPTITPSGTYSPPPADQSIITVLSQFGSIIINILLTIAGAIALIYIIWAGMQYIQAQGDAAKAKSARNALVNAVIGIVIILSAFVIIRFASSIANCISNPAACSAQARQSAPPPDESTPTPDPNASNDQTPDPNEPPYCGPGSTDPRCPTATPYQDCGSTGGTTC